MMIWIMDGRGDISFVFSGFCSKFTLPYTIICNTIFHNYFIYIYIYIYGVNCDPLLLISYLVHLNLYAKILSFSTKLRNLQF